MKRIDVVIAILCRQGQILIAQRRRGDRFESYWEFPGGKQEEGESPSDALHREMREELAITISDLEELPTVEHDYPDFQVRLHPFVCALTAGNPDPLACQQLRWVNPRALGDYSFPEANASLIELLVRRFTP